MHILIDGLSARIGGGITRLLGTLTSLIDIAPENVYTLIVSRRYQQKLIERLPHGVNVYLVDFGPNLFRRAWFQNVELFRIARRLAVDVVFAASEGAYLLSPVPLVMMAGNMLIVDESNWRYSVVRRKLTSRAFKACCRVVFVSEALRDAAVSAGMLERSKTVVAYHGVNPMFAPGDERDGSYLLAVSSLMPHKGYLTLIDAYARVAEISPPLRIVGPLQDLRTVKSVRTRIDNYGLQERVALMGAVEFSQLPEAYRQAVALIFPSEVESFGLPLAEAMACGTPVIATDLPVCREICGDAALYFPAGDAGALARCVERFSTEPETRQHARSAGLARRQKFDWNESTRTLLETFRTCAASK